MTFKKLADMSDAAVARRVKEVMLPNHFSTQLCLPLLIIVHPLNYKLSAKFGEQERGSSFAKLKIDNG